jgi:hypothetical protein
VANRLNVKNIQCMFLGLCQILELHNDSEGNDIANCLLTFTYFNVRHAVH